MSKKLSEDNEVWYSQGLRFKCTGCGKCCGGAPGYVWLSEFDIERLSKHLKVSKGEFLNKHCRQVGDKYSLKERSITYNCVFLKDNQCSVYEGRPTQCRTFPFWGKNLESKRNWQETRLECEGIEARDADLIPLSTIRKKMSEEE